MTLAPKEFSPFKPCVHRCKPEQCGHEVSSSRKCVDSYRQYQAYAGELDTQPSLYRACIPVGMDRFQKEDDSSCRFF